MTKERRSEAQELLLLRRHIAALNRDITSGPIASCSSSSSRASVDRIFVSADVSTNAEED